MFILCEMKKKNIRRDRSGCIVSITCRSVSITALDREGLTWPWQDKHFTIPHGTAVHPPNNYHDNNYYYNNIIIINFHTINFHFILFFPAICEENRRLTKGTVRDKRVVQEIRYAPMLRNEETATKNLNEGRNKTIGTSASSQIRSHSLSFFFFRQCF